MPLPVLVILNAIPALAVCWALALVAHRALHLPVDRPDAGRLRRCESEPDLADAA